MLVHFFDRLGDLVYNASLSVDDSLIFSVLSRSELLILGEFILGPP